MTPVDGSRSVFLDLRDTATRFALSFAVDEAGWTRALEPGAAAAVVADHLPDRDDAPVLDVLVLPPSPIAGRRGIDAFVAGRARSVVASDDPTALPEALEAGRRGLSIVSAVLVTAAQDFPHLPARLERTLHLVVRGRTNRDIARELGQSEATTKRDIAALLVRFDAPNRVALAATAWRLGLPPPSRP